MLSESFGGIDSFLKKHTAAVTGVFIIYIIALCTGVLSVIVICEAHSDWLLSFYENIAPSTHYADVDFLLLCFSAFKINIKYLLLMFVSGFIVIGVPFVFAVLFVRVFFLGISAGTMYLFLSSDGLLNSFFVFFIQNAVTLPIMMIYAVICARFSIIIFKSASGIFRRENDFARSCVSNTALFLLFCILVFASSAIESFLVFTLS